MAIAQSQMKAPAQRMYLKYTHNPGSECKRLVDSSYLEISA